MKNFRFFFLTLALGTFLCAPSTSKAQGGNPLKNIPITDMAHMFENATFSIDDFFVKDNTIYVSSTLRGSFFGQPMVVPDVASPVTIANSTCSTLSLEIGAVPVSISNENIIIGSFSVNATNKRNNDNRITNALCSIAKLKESNASLNTIVGKLKDALRAY